MLCAGTLRFTTLHELLQAAVYGKCVLAHADGLQKDVCAEAFHQLKQCFQAAVCPIRVERFHKWLGSTGEEEVMGPQQPMSEPGAAQPGAASAAPPAAVTPASAAQPRPKADPYAFMTDYRRIPCFRQSMMWGTGLGMAVTTHNIFMRKPPLLVLRNGVFATFGVATISWWICRYRFKATREATRFMMETQEAKPVREAENN